MKNKSLWIFSVKLSTIAPNIFAFSYLSSVGLGAQSDNKDKMFLIMFENLHMVKRCWVVTNHKLQEQYQTYLFSFLHCFPQQKFVASSGICPLS